MERQKAYLRKKQVVSTNFLGIKKYKDTFIPVTVTAERYHDYPLGEDFVEYMVEYDGIREVVTDRDLFFGSFKHC